MLLVKIISGGQTGADQAGLRAAKLLGLQTGGWAPQRWLTEHGACPDLAYYGLLQHASFRYAARTEANVRESDATLLFGLQSHTGTMLTRRFCVAHKKPFYAAYWPTVARAGALSPQQFREWLRLHNVITLNVAGNRESGNPGIGDACERFLLSALR